MNALILTCGTGGGHNTAAEAVAEELKVRGHQVFVMNPYDLGGKKTAQRVDNLYVKLVQKSPNLFGCLYQLGNIYRNLPIHSPVYYLNGRMRKPLEAFLDQHHFDVIIMTHIFPGMMLAHLKKCREGIPRTIFVGTDYTCIPFTEELDCDAYMIPSKDLVQEYVRYGIPEEKIYPVGIPVKKDSCQKITRKEAREILGWSQNKQYIVLSGGSIGAGKLWRTEQILEEYIKDDQRKNLIVICGNNEKLYDKFKKKVKAEQVKILKSVSNLPVYMKACDLFLTKPGGLTSTEAAVVGTNLVHLSPIPGCESKNRAYFEACHMSRSIESTKKDLRQLVKEIDQTDIAEEVTRAQKKKINRKALEDICDYIEKNAKKQKSFKKVLTSNQKADNILQVLSNSC